MTTRLLQKMMLKEEAAVLFGNADLALGTPATPTAFGWRFGRDPAGADLQRDRRRADRWKATATRR
jgi:hypothetical protein